ncbi:MULTISPECIES: hypothetical protein [Achromobacter]|uniref:hypothetical protein n=1 Tax=Achromobacter TaxID=222 RepID=UPI0023F6C26E|nr:hypothetical protein [Achromobacter anxifer]MDF8365093.1 hypothetical protein [Achromobacter anxifer]
MTAKRLQLVGAIAFLRSIGLTVHERAGATGFIPGVRITEGALAVDPAVCSVSGLLHEAGHIAVVPKRYRMLLDGNVSKGQKEMLERAALEERDPDGPLYRAVVQASDPEATAWAWAAGKALGLADELIIMDEEYDGEGAFVRLQLQAQAYAGINGLSYAGFCAINERVGAFRQLPVYPALKWWLQAA